MKKLKNIKAIRIVLSEEEIKAFDNFRKYIKKKKKLLKKFK